MKPNKTDAPNPAIARPFQVGRQDLEKSVISKFSYEFYYSCIQLALAWTASSD